MSSSSSLLNHTFLRLKDGQSVSLTEFSGRVIVAVNTASECMFTGQYRGLETLYERYKNQGLVVLGFPSNDFGQQEPGKDGEIAEFCERTYEVQFPMFSKTSVKGAYANTFYRELYERTRSVPRWNFHKYVIFSDGETVKSFSALTFPMSWRFIRTIESALAKISPAVH